MLLLAVVVLSPTSTQQSGLLVELVLRAREAGASPRLVTFARLEVVANVVMVVPVGLLAALGWPRTAWQAWAAYGFLGALAVELAQALVLPARDGSPADVVANTLGVLLGALVVAAVRTTPRRGRAAPLVGRGSGR